MGATTRSIQILQISMEGVRESRWRIEALCFHGHGITRMHSLRDSGTLALIPYLKTTDLRVRIVTQAAEDKRSVFRNELQRVGVEGAKVLRFIGEKLKTMERLNPIEDILHEIHQAAEELQSKIDKKSYLLVNAETWEIGNRSKDLTDEIKISNLDEDVSRILAHKSQSEATIRPPKNWDVGTTTSKNPNPATIQSQQSRTAMQKQSSWPSRISLTPGSLLITPGDDDEAAKMYRSASALSLATFASLLIEFVARLENLVNAYDELCEIANFKEAA